MTRRTAFLTALAVGLGAVFAGSAAAHDQPFSSLDLHLAPDSVTGRVLAHVEDLGRSIALDHPESLLDARFAARHEPALERALGERLSVRLDGRALEPAFDPGSTRVPDRPLLAFSFRAGAPTAGRLDVRGPLFPDDPEHQTFLDVYEGDTLTHQAVLDASHREATFFTRGRQSLRLVLRTFVGAGIHHIFIGPDHILFVIGLLLPGGGFRRLLKIVTSFTVAHSITLALATLHVVNPPSRVIEPAIALSIVAIGIENFLAGPGGAGSGEIRPRAPRAGGRDLRAPIAFAFGLVHGFGFAGVLSEFGLPRAALGASLFAFNLGVEIGQLAIVLAVAPALGALATRSAPARRRVTEWGSAAVIAAGGYWLVQRLFFAG